MNEAIAVSSSPALVLDTHEDAIRNEVSLVERTAMDVVINNDDDFEMAAEITKNVKRVNKKVTEYWEPLRVSTKKAYDDVLKRKKEMLAPLEAAERILKGKIGDYTMKKEAERRQREAVMRELARKEAERKLEEAAKAEAAGDSLAAEFAMAEAEVMETACMNAHVASNVPKANGVTHSRTWKIVNIDISKVPTEIAGTIIRPVDESAVMALIKATKGQIQIPGIEYQESMNISVRT